MPAPHIPNEAVEQILSHVHAANQDDEIAIVVIAVKQNEPPSICGTVHPTIMPELFQFLLDHHGNATVTADMLGGTIN